MDYAVITWNYSIIISEADSEADIVNKQQNLSIFVKFCDVTVTSMSHARPREIVEPYYFRISYAANTMSLTTEHWLMCLAKCEIRIK